MGSRNAVVALKLEQEFIHFLTSYWKQERRGGIETVFDLHHQLSRPPRSRNAVVALKRKVDVHICAHAVPKQERRGGIETGSRPGGRAPCRAKQERRGGIETSSSLG